MSKLAISLNSAMKVDCPRARPSLAPVRVKLRSTRSTCASAAGLSGACRGWRQSLGLGMFNWFQCPAVEQVPGKVSGAWVFKGTRVPVRALFENLEDGARVEDFLEWFPGVTRDQALAVLRHAEATLEEAAV